LIRSAREARDDTMDQITDGRVLALDLGRKRTGIALSDPSARLARPLETVSLGSRALLEHVRQLIRAHEVAAVVVGRPILPSGEPGEIGRWADEFAERLRKETGIAVVLWDEGLTTWEAEGLVTHRARRTPRARAARRAAVDRAAAALILQDYLDHRDAGGSREGSAGRD
jgi:putative Holliday junction resolvase